MKTKDIRKLLFGLVFIIAGGLLLLSHFDMIELLLPRYVYSWKMILIILGVIFLLSDKNRTTGIILLLIGGIFIAPDIFHIPLSEVMKIAFPILLIIIGFYILFWRNRKDKPKYYKNSVYENVDFIDETNIFSGSNKKIKSVSFKGGQVTSIFGGVELDFRDCELSSENNNVLNVVAIFGGCTLIIPEGWTLKNDVSAVFGGTSDERGKEKDDIELDKGKVLVLKGSVIFGGIEIKSYP